MSKKILSVVLALTMIFSLLAISASAIGAAGFESEEDVSTYTQSWGLGEPVDNEDGTWSVDVTLAANYVVGGIQFQVANTNNEGVVLVDFVPNDEVFTDDYGAKISVFNSTGIVVIIPSPLAEGSEGIDLTAGAVLGQLVYEVAEGESADINIVNDGKSSTNPGGNLIAARLSDGNLSTGTSITGQTVLSVGEKRTIGGAAMVPAELVLTATGASKGVIIDTHKTFGGAYAGVVYGISATTYKTKANITNNVEASNGGSLVVSASDGKTAASGNYGTGSTIEVLNSDGTSTGKTYVFVVFGDVDGNGLINTADAQAALAAISNASLAPNNSVKRMAANAQLLNNATMMHTLNSNDVQSILKHVTGTKIDQPTYAARQNGFNNFYQ